MISFSSFALIETIVTWFKSNITVLILSGAFTSYYLGLYKTPISIDNSIIGLLYAALIPVLYSGLSKTKNSKKEFENVFFQIQKIMAIIAFPIGMVMIVFDDVITKILLGNQWLNVAWFIGLYGCSIVIENVFCIFCVEAYRAVGKPHISAITVAINAFCLGLTIYLTKLSSFEIVCWVTVLNSLFYFIVQMFFLKLSLNISPFKVCKNVTPYFLLSVFIGIIGKLIKSKITNVYLEILCIVFLGIIYILMLLLYPSTREELLSYIIN